MSHLELPMTKQLHHNQHTRSARLGAAAAAVKALGSDSEEEDDDFACGPASPVLAGARWATGGARSGPCQRSASTASASSDAGSGGSTRTSHSSGAYSGASTTSARSTSSGSSAGAAAAAAAAVTMDSSTPHTGSYTSSRPAPLTEDRGRSPCTAAYVSPRLAARQASLAVPLAITTATTAAVAGARSATDVALARGSIGSSPASPFLSGSSPLHPKRSPLSPRPASPVAYGSAAAIEYDSPVEQAAGYHGSKLRSEPCGDRPMPAGADALLSASPCGSDEPYPPLASPPRSNLAASPALAHAPSRRHTQHERLRNSHELQQQRRHSTTSIAHGPPAVRRSATQHAYTPSSPQPQPSNQSTPQPWLQNPAPPPHAQQPSPHPAHPQPQPQPQPQPPAPCPCEELRFEDLDLTRARAAARMAAVEAADDIVYVSAKGTKGKRRGSGSEPMGAWSALKSLANRALGRDGGSGGGATGSSAGGGGKAGADAPAAAAGGGSANSAAGLRRGRSGKVSSTAVMPVPLSPGAIVVPAGVGRGLPEGPASAPHSPLARWGSAAAPQNTAGSGGGSVSCAGVTGDAADAAAGGPAAHPTLQVMPSRRRQAHGPDGPVAFASAPSSPAYAPHPPTSPAPSRLRHGAPSRLEVETSGSEFLGRTTPAGGDGGTREGALGSRPDAAGSAVAARAAAGNGSSLLSQPLPPIGTGYRLRA
ncbi:hypothetical protein HYH03_001035 [Edaphochlamys debaryana]|uniref:Uncharacterized protein n=1 Tax=Edaphochlamys debaryana TaxID=47281 RepID=A0A835YE74_9CHLO|nr:hypothetical protein HYH03_001035 [Edaphochlamys debaryana]|eukprot:KAG2501225.1 hypothetical protein HYH03_001035 [Edaphochlamys debaryana]